MILLIIHSGEFGDLLQMHEDDKKAAQQVEVDYAKGQLIYNGKHINLYNDNQLYIAANKIKNKEIATLEELQVMICFRTEIQRRKRLNKLLK